MQQILKTLAERKTPYGKSIAYEYIELDFFILEIPCSKCFYLFAVVIDGVSMPPAPPYLCMLVM